MEDDGADRNGVDARLAARLPRCHLPDALAPGLVDVVDLLQLDPFRVRRGEGGSVRYAWFVGL